MMDVMTDFFKRKVKKDGVTIMVQSHDGRQYIIEKSHFVTRQNKSIAQRGHLESPLRAARRVMRFLDAKVRPEDFEVFKPRNLGPNRTHFVVWFPQKSVFREDDERWRGHLFPVEAEDALTPAQLRAVRYISAEAIKMYEKRREQKVA